MALELKRKKDGSLRSRYWYGRYEINGKKYCANLDVPVDGAVPLNLRLADDELDPVFLESRKEAQKSLERHMREARSGKSAAVLARKVYEIEAGNMLDDAKLTELVERWEAIPRRRQPCKKYLDTGKRIVSRFVEFVAQRYPNLKKAGQVTPDVAMAFMRFESERKLSGRTWNVSLTILKGLFTHLQKTLGLIFNPFSAITSRLNESVPREPFTQDDLNAILESSKSDPALRPVIITAICTAMRRGDCCLLKWKHVDLKAGFIAVKTAKTGEVVEIPILPMLHAELSALPRNGAYVFPEIASAYQRCTDNINRRLSEILEKVGFVDSKKVDRAKKLAGKVLPAVSSERLLELGLKAIDEARMSDGKRDRMRDCFKRYHAGQSVPVISRELNLGRGTVSDLLNELEGKIKVAIIRRPVITLPAQIRGEQRTVGEGKRLRRVSVKGWHSFRTTWITMALSAGVPEELVRRVSGHTTVDVVRKHYFRPGREQFRAALAAAMPNVLIGKGEEQMRPEEELAPLATKLASGAATDEERSRFRKLANQLLKAVTP